MSHNRVSIVLSCEVGHAKCTRVLPASSKDLKSVGSLEEFCEFPDDCSSSAAKMSIIHLVAPAKVITEA